MPSCDQFRRIARNDFQANRRTSRHHTISITFGVSNSYVPTVGRLEPTVVIGGRRQMTRSPTLRHGNNLDHRRRRYRYAQGTAPVINIVIRAGIGSSATVRRPIRCQASKRSPSTARTTSWSTSSVPPTAASNHCRLQSITPRLTVQFWSHPAPTPNPPITILTPDMDDTSNVTNPVGLLVDQERLTIEGVDASGNPITSASGTAGDDRILDRVGLGNKFLHYSAERHDQRPDFPSDRS